jgi:hypothetical protein
LHFRDAAGLWFEFEFIVKIIPEGTMVGTTAGVTMEEATGVLVDGGAGG